MKFSAIFKATNSKWIIWLTVISVTWVNFNQERWLGKNVLNHDVGQYYSYLPAFFYHNDLKLAFIGDSLHPTPEGRNFAPRYTSEGKPVLKMSMGMAISYAPFFGLSHLYAVFANKPRDAYSEPYQFAVLFSSLFYYVLGLYFLSTVLLRFFNQSVVSLCLFCITFGTNTFYYLTIGAGMSHTVGFAFVALFVLYTIKWHEDQKLLYAFILGLACGYLTLVRPINILVLVFFLFYQIKTKQDFKLKVLLIKDHFIHFLVLGITGVLVFLPQLLYWKHITGHYFFNSYVGEHFYFNNPHVFKALFGFRKGWLIYTPIMWLAMLGIIALLKEKKALFLPILLFLVIYIYVAFSWWCWWYGGSFSQRVLIDIYPILALPFAYMLLVIKKYRPMFKTISYSIITFIILLNLLQTIQAKYNILHYDSMTLENYRRIFFTITTKPDREKYLQKPNYKRALQGLDE